MSRIGKKPIDIPSGVTVTLSGQEVKVKGPKGELIFRIHQRVKAEQKDGQLLITRLSDIKGDRQLHGLTRSLLANMVIGVTEGYAKKLEVIGVGYRAAMKGKDLELNVGFSHPVLIKPLDGVDLSVEEARKQIFINVVSCDKQKTGEMSAKIRAVYPPEPYKGKGIKYTTEIVRRKAGKTAGSS